MSKVTEEEDGTLVVHAIDGGRLFFNKGWLAEHGWARALQLTYELGFGNGRDLPGSGIQLL